MNPLSILLGDGRPVLPPVIGGGQRRAIADRQARAVWLAKFYLHTPAPTGESRPVRRRRERLEREGPKLNKPRRKTRIA